MIHVSFAMPRSARRRVPLATAILCLLFLGVAGCETSRSSRARQRHEETNTKLFRDLIERGTIEPVEDFDENEYFDELARIYGDERPVDPESDSGEGEGTEGEPEDEPEQDVPINNYLEFGKRIQVYEETGFVMKPYSLPSGMGKNAFDLLQTYGDFPIHGLAIDGEGFPDPNLPQPEDSVVLDLRQGWNVHSYADPRKPVLTEPATIKLGDTLFVTAKPEVLREVEHFINLFIADVRQIEIEAKIVEVKTTDSLDIGIIPVDDSTPIFGLPNAGTFVNSVDFSFSNTAPTTEALFGLGAVFDGVEFNAVLEAVAAYENVSIISRPKVAVSEGARADIVNISKIPFFNIGAINASGGFTTTITYEDVGVQMYVIPRVIGEKTVILNIDIEASQQTGTAVTFAQQTAEGTSVFNVPEISVRKARTIVRLEPGQAVILGGLISESVLERESKVPILGDIPLLGQLFKNTFREKEQTNVLFFIRPRVLEGIDRNIPFGD